MSQTAPPNSESRLGKIASRLSDGGWALAEQGSQSAANFLTVALVGLIAGLDALAIYQMGRFLVLLVAGIQNSLISFPYTITFRRLERENPEGSFELAGSQLLLSVMLGLLLIPCFAIGLFFSTDVSISRMLMALLFAVPAYLIREFLRRHDFAHLRTRTTFLFSILTSVLQVIGLVLLWRTEILTAANAFIAIAVACSLTSFFWWVLRRNEFSYSPAQLWNRLKTNWTIGKWIFSTQTLTDSFLAAVQWALVLFGGKTAGGVFAACFQIVSLCNPVVMGLANVLPPKFAKTFSESNREQLLQSIQNFNRSFVLILGVVLCGIVVFCELLLKLVSKETVEQPYHLMLVLAAMMLVQAIGLPAFHGLNAIEKPDRALQPRLIGVGVSIVFLGLFGIWYGALGAAYALLIANLIISWLTYSRVKFELQPMPCDFERKIS